MSETGSELNERILTELGKAIEPICYEHQAENLDELQVALVALSVGILGAVWGVIPAPGSLHEIAEKVAVLASGGAPELATWRMD